MCGGHIDRLALHRLSYKLATGRLTRHAAINDLLVRALRQAGILCTKEPRHLSPNDALRPDGLTSEPWSRGRVIIWDVTVKDSFAPSFRRIARNVRAVAARGEGEKETKYDSLLNEFIFVPFVIESTGVWGNEALTLVKQICCGTRWYHRWK